VVVPPLGVGLGLEGVGDGDDDCDGDAECDGLGVAGGENFEDGDGDAECLLVPGADVPGPGTRPPPECLRAALEPIRFDPDCLAWPDDRAGLDPAGLPETEIPGATAGRWPGADAGAGPLKAT